MKTLVIYAGCLLMPCIMVVAPLVAQVNNNRTAQSAKAWFDTEPWKKAVAAKTHTLQYDAFGRVLEEEDTAAKANVKLLKLQPHTSVNKILFAKYYQADKAWWDEAFAYLQQTNLSELQPGKFSIDGDNVMVTVTEGLPRQMDSTHWEAHRHYADIHYVITGKERIGLTGLAGMKPFGQYLVQRDLQFYDGDGKYYTVEPGVFFVFFPPDVHRPNLQAGAEKDKKIVIKVKISQP